ncbi:surface-adhesin E family protein [Kaistella sp.]|uniref:surface-adhesin E family protein n=1 Tax=Kaistella sp. TaxID=2782235 RepID=UPI002F941C22
MKNILLLATIFLFSNLYSQTNEWEFIGSAPDSNSYYYKPNSENKAWIKIESPQLEYINKEGQRKYVDGYQVTLWQFDCEEKQIGIVQTTTYDKKGLVLNTLSIKNFEIDMTYVNPDSMGEVYLTAFCQRN